MPINNRIPWTLIQRILYALYIERVVRLEDDKERLDLRSRTCNINEYYNAFISSRQDDGEL